MRNPNGFGGVIKLSGKRRKPFAVRISNGFDKEGKQKYKYLGYYETRKEALYQLSLYNTNPYNVDLKKLTLSNIYNRFMDTKKDKISETSFKNYTFLYKYLKPLQEMKMSNIKTAHLQTLIDNLTKVKTNEKLSSSSLKRIKSLLSNLFTYAMKLDVIEKNYSQFIEMPKHEIIIVRKIFTPEEIETLWKNIDKIKHIDTILILIYTGMRINELLKLKKENVDLINDTIIGGSKTEAGKNRIIPIHPKIKSLIINRMNTPTEFLICNVTGKNKYSYTNFKTCHFNKIMHELKMSHTPHDTRHTFATMLTEVSNNDTAITGIIGHVNINMTKKYTHTNIEKMRKEIEKIDK